MHVTTLNLTILSEPEAAIDPVSFLPQWQADSGTIDSFVIF